MSTRFGHIATQTFVDNRTGHVRWIILIAVAVAVLMLYVGGKVQIVRLGYRIEELEKQKGELERANRALQIEASSLASPARIEEIAVKKLGMVRPSKENVVAVRRRDGSAAASGKERGRR
jgi:cell division protein FtsL